MLIFKQENRKNWDSIASNLPRILRDEKYLKGDWEVAPKKHKKAPSMNQRRYYWAVILPAISNYQTNEGNHYKVIQDLHDDIKSAVQDQFGLFDEIENKITGKIERRPISLSDKKGDRENVSKFIDAVLIWSAQELGLNIPNPYKVI